VLSQDIAASGAIAIGMVVLASGGAALAAEREPAPDEPVHHA
jgi:hypothetical protein